MLTEGLFPLGFSYEKDTRLYFDDTCVVPERLEGKSAAPEEGWGVTRTHGGRLGAGLQPVKANLCWCGAVESCRASSRTAAWHHCRALSPSLPPPHTSPRLQRRRQHLSPLRPCGLILRRRFPAQGELSVTVRVPCWGAQPREGQSWGV